MIENYLDALERIEYLDILEKRWFEDSTWLIKLPKPRQTLSAPPPLWSVTAVSVFTSRKLKAESCALKADSSS
jgi:hypothetical protein